VSSNGTYSDICSTAGSGDNALEDLLLVSRLWWQH
jgi:hypothetical protein